MVDGEDKLRDLLLTTDAAMRAPREAPDLAERVRRRVAARRGAKRRGTLIAASLLAVVGFGVLNPRGPDRRSPAGAPVVDPAALEARIARLQVEADLRLALIDATRAQRTVRARIAALEAEIRRPLPDPRAAARAGVENAAQTLLAQGDRLLHEMHLRRAARQRYEQIVALFPETTSAGVARLHLRTLDGPM